MLHYVYKHAKCRAINLCVLSNINMAYSKLICHFRVKKTIPKYKLELHYYLPPVVHKGDRADPIFRKEQSHQLYDY